MFSSVKEVRTWTPLMNTTATSHYSSPFTEGGWYYLVMITASEDKIMSTKTDVRTFFIFLPHLHLSQLKEDQVLIEGSQSGLSFPLSDELEFTDL